MQREDVERLADGMEREIRRVTGINDLQSEEAEALRALLYRAERAEAERDAAFAAGRDAVALWAEGTACDGYLDGPSGEWIARLIRALAIKPHP